jgi:transposase
VDVLGIDVSKADFHACLLQSRGRSKQVFENTPAGYRRLKQWLRNRRSFEVHACMEATGAYWIALATALHEAGLIVSVVNPSRTVFFARSQLRRTKTDRVDAESIAQFCQTQHPDTWLPPAPEIRELRGLLSYRDQLVGERVRLKQVAKEVHVGKRLQQLHDAHLDSLADAIDAIEEQIRVLLKGNDAVGAGVVQLEKSVAGFGLITAAAIVAKLPVERLRDGKAAAAYVGLTPRERQSGTSVLGKPRICKTGDATLRRDLYMPALVAMRYNPILSAFAQRLKDRGKPPKVIIVAVMRKLIVLAYNILKATAAGQPAATA